MNRKIVRDTEATDVDTQDGTRNIEKRVGMEVESTYYHKAATHKRPTTRVFQR